MDPITILGITTAIVQLVDFCHGVIGESYQIISNSAQMPMQLEKLSELGTSDNALCDKLLGTIVSRQPRGDDEALLQKVVESLQTSLNALHNILDRFTSVPSGGLKSSAKAVTVALKARWKRSDIERIAEDIERAQARLSNVLLHLVRKYQVLQHDGVFHCIATYGVDHSALIASLKDTLLVSLSEHKENLTRAQCSIDTVTSGNDRLQSQITEFRRTFSDFTAEGSRQFQRISKGQDVLTQQVSKLTARQKCQRFLRSLWYSGIDYRRETIADKARGTFEWIFEQYRNPFMEWIAGDKPLFRISGKAGSGKPTLIFMAMPEFALS